MTCRAIVSKVLVGIFCCSCGIREPRYINYQEPGGQGADLEVCLAAVENLKLGFNSSDCNCHTATEPVLSGDSATDRSNLLQISLQQYQGDPRNLITYLKSDHTGSFAIDGEVEAALDAWTEVEQDHSLCETSSGAESQQ